MDAAYMSKRVRIRCGRCRTVNVVAVDESVDPRRGRG
jgi:phage FluMu protein Com